MKFIQEAYKGENAWWAYVLTLMLFIVGWQFVGVIPLVVTAFYHAGDFSSFMTAAESSFTNIGINSNLYLFLVIFSFFGGLIGLYAGLRAIHKRSLKSVVTSRKKTDWNRIFYAFGVWGLIGILMVVIGYALAPEDYVWNFKPFPFLILAVISFLFLPIQTTMEELLFRGYLLQGFGTWFKNKFVALILTSAIFGLLHGLNPEVEKLGWIIMIYYIGTGMVLGIFTLMDEGTELAIGFHAANNIIAALLVTADWVVFQTDALLIDTSEPSVGFEMYIPIFVLYPIMLLVFSKKYGWTNWEEKLFGTVRKPVPLNEDEFIA